MLNDSSNKEPQFATEKAYVKEIQTTKDKYNRGISIKFETESIKLILCDYSDALTLVTGDITVNTDIASKNCALFSACRTEINDVFTDEANHIYIAMPIYNLIEYSANYSDISESLWQFQRDEFPGDNADRLLKLLSHLNIKQLL